MEKTTAQDIMSTELITIREDDTVEDALKALVNHRITGLPVVDKRGRLIGIISEYDLIRQLSKHKKIKQEAFMERIEFSRETHGLPASTPLAEIVEKFLSTKFRRMPVLDKKNKLIGIITRRDLMRLFFYRAKLT
jgi:CBS domain-containing protein